MPSARGANKKSVVEERIVHLTNLPSSYQFHTKTTSIHCEFGKNERAGGIESVVYYDGIRLHSLRECFECLCARNLSPLTHSALLLRTIIII